MLGTRRVCAAAWLLRAALGPEPGRSASGARGQGWLQPAGYDTGVKVYNSLTRRKDPLIVSRADAASWYSCGPTVYDHAHLGHACSYVRFDIIRRILTRVFGCNVVMVMGITDVDDKIIRRANEMSVSPASLARLYEEDFKQDMAALKVLPPTAYLRVTEHVPQIITFIERLIANGHAYCTAKGNVYFDLRSRGDRYGKLAGVAPGPAGEPGHLHVKGGGEKMSKSLKNYITIKDFLRSASPDVFRLFCLRSSYRSAIDYSEGALLEARRLLRATAAFVEDARAYVRGQLAGGPVQEDVLWERLGRTKAAVQAALADDFDTVRAVDAVMDLVHHGNRQLKAAAEEPRGARSPAVLGAIVASVEQFFETVGISLAERQCVPGAGSPAALHSLVEELVRFRLKVRQFALASGEAPGEARQQRLLERQPLLEACDTLRRDLAVHGISIKERLVHVGAAGSEDRRPQTQELRTATVLRPLSHSKAFM
ncbi:PREDICTED: probable cysteine--tRNA ligase, mitochondrial isoform X3 [Capra hircus]|uniref:probable cysteine--tRNA ligase, mitochondrial isoform X3 n=1 Tax=Capra hircus TaxID=9925 RepID=UPI000847550D|nr:PREDICTED: probable cysteine--tRNA ligase, mitochondrial isoform X3 [Capra hircus]